MAKGLDMKQLGLAATSYPFIVLDFQLVDEGKPSCAGNGGRAAT